MKEREDYRSKKALAIGAGIAAAVVVAVGGTVAFIKSRPNSTAVNNVVENQITNSVTTNDTNEVVNNEVSNTSTNSTTNKGNTVVNNTVENNVVSNNTTETNNSTTNTTTKPVSTNNNHSSDFQQGTNTQTNSQNTTLTQEFVQETVVEGKKNIKVYDERDVEWTPLSLAAISGAVQISKTNLDVVKNAYVNGIVVEDGDESYVAHVGDTITYEIRITNNNSKAKTFNSYDVIPEGTKLVEDSISEGGVEKDGKISWKTTVNPKKTVCLTFDVIVQKDIKVVKNKATVNGVPTNETKTPIITSEKEVLVLDSEGKIMDGVTVATAGQTLLYTIRVRNTSDVKGIANVSDTIATEALTVDESSITEGGNYSKGLITWNNVIVPANDRAKLQFKATVNSEGEFSLVSNKAEVNGTPTNEVKTPIITSEKHVEVLDNSGNVMPGVTTANAGQKVLYTIKVNNSSEVEGKADISDTINAETLTIDTSSISVGGKYDEKSKTITWNNVSVPANGNKEVKFIATINAEGEFNVVSNTAKVNDVPTEEVKTPIITSEKHVEVLDAEGNVITGVTTASKGQKLLYTIKVNNSSEVEGKAKITDRVDTNILTIDESSITEGGKYADGKVTWENVAVPANGNKEVKFVAIINTEGEFNVVTNKAKVNDVPTEEVKTPIVTSDKEVQVLDNNGDPIEGATVAIKGQTLLYTIRVRNTSDVEGKANITDTIDDKALIVDTSSITEGGNYSNGTITWNNVTVPSKNDTVNKGRAKLQFKATVNTEGEFNVVTNKAEVNGEPTNEVKTPIITATKTPSVEFAKNGDVYTYTIVVTNHSEISGKTTISDKVPEGTSYVPDTIVGGGNYDEATKTITWNNIEVKPGTTTVSFNVKVEKDTVDAIKNTAKVNDHDVPSDDVPVAKVKIDKKLVDEDPNRKYKIGEKVSYVITVTNLGSKDLSNVVVKDDLTVRDSINSKVATVTSIKVGNNNVSDFASYISQEDKDGDAILVITIPELKVEDKEAEIKLEYEVTAEDVGVGNHKIINTATVETTETPDPTPIPEDPTVETDSYTNVSVIKEWDDNNNQDGKRANSVFVTLKANGNDADSSLNVTNPRVELNDSNSWKYEWVKVLANKDGRAINYTVVEDDVTFEENGETRKYTSTIETLNKTERNTDYKVINKHEPIPYNEDPDDPDVKPGTITITKVWNDKDDQDGKRPESITVHLIGTIKGDDGNDVEVSSAEYQVKKSENWTKTISNLPKYNSGKEITYSVTEDTIDNYTTTTITAVTDGKVSITNSHDTEWYNGTGDLTITKSWNDNDNQDGKRPDSITVHVIGTIKNDDGSNKEVSNAEYNITPEDWTLTVHELPKYNSGKEITYTVTENEIANYTIETIPAVKNGAVTITNTHVPEKFNGKGEVTVIKVWDDANNQDNKRSAIGFTLYADKTAYDEVILAEKNVDPNNPNVWTYTWTDLDKYKDGKEIVYTVVETKTDSDYSSTISQEVPAEGNNAGKVTITNTHVVDTTNYVVTKVWNDHNNQDGYREDVEIALYGQVDNQDKELVKTVKTSDASTNDVQIQKNGNNWTVTFNNLPVNKENEVGKKVTYSAEELTNLSNYSKTTKKNSEYQSTIENTHATDKTTYTAVKAWDDENDRDGLHTSFIAKVQLKANNENQGNPVELNSANKFTYTWDNLEKKADGRDITYSVEEVDLPNSYEIASTEVNGNIATITNKHIPEKYNEDGKLKVTKVWDDDNNSAGFRPSEITINVVGTANGNTVYSNSDTINATKTSVEFTNLYKYDNGKEIVYTVTEGDYTHSDKYTTTTAYGVKTDATGAEVENKGEVIVTNSYTPETVNIVANKVWEDINETTSVVVTLNKSYGTAETATLDHTTTSKTWSNLPKYHDAKEITYTVSEANIAKYVKDTQVSEDGNTTTYTFKNSKGYIDVVKTFKEIQDVDGNKITSRTTAEKGDILVYKITATNNGFVDLTNVKVTDNRRVTVKETGVTATYSEANNTTTISGKNDNKLAKGSQVTYTVYYTVTEEDMKNADVPLVNKATATGDYTDSTGTTVTPKDESKESTVVKTEHPDVTVTKVSDHANQNRNLRPGDTVTYTVTVKNTGNTVLDNISVVDELTLNSAAHGGLTINPNDSVYTVSSNAEGTVYTVTFKNELAINASVSYTATYKVVSADTSDNQVNILGNKVTVDTDKTDPEDTTVTDKVDNTKISITITKEWDDTLLTDASPGVTVHHPEVTFDVFVGNSTTKVKSGTLEEDARSVVISDLDKYDDNGNTIKYTIKENPVRHYDADIPVEINQISDTEFSITIKNTFVQDIDGEVEVTLQRPPVESKIPMDIVLVLDFSSSMVNKDKLSDCRVGKLIDAVNSIMTKINTDNPGSRIGIMTYNTNETELLPLGVYTPVNGKYLVGSKNNKVVTVKATVNGNSNYKTATTAKGTYTHLGVVRGAEMLINETTTTATVNNKTVTRTPVMILLTDGEPYKGNTELDCSGTTEGVSESTRYANTIKAAYKYKGDITTHYYGEQAGVAEEKKKSSKFYTIGYDIDTNLAKALLDPTKENIDKVSGVKAELGGDPAAYGYDYCDKSFLTTMGDNDLASIFDKIVEDASESTQHDLNPEDIYHERIDLPDININKKFTLTITKGSGDSTTTVYSVTTESAEQFNFELGREDVNYLKQDANTGGYYIDLLEVQPDSHVKVTYISVN